MQFIRTRPAIDGDLGWYDISPSRHLRAGKRLKGAHRFDIAIVGAGFVGVALARRLAELRPQSTIALIDALETGQGASGRNAGFLIDVPHNVDGAQGDAAHHRRLYDLNRFAIDRLRALKDEFRIACEWNEAGKFMSAHETRNIARLEQFAAALRQAGMAHEIVEGEALRRRLGTAYYQAAVYTPGSVLVNPASLVRGLAASLPESVTLFESSPVLACSGADAHVLSFLGGTLRADTLVLAVGGFTEAFGQETDRLASIFTYASLTDPLPAGEGAGPLAGIAPWGTTSAHPAGTTVRFTSDRRIFVRNTFHVRPDLRSSAECLQQAWRQHRQSFEARFPALAAVDFSHTWGGLVTMTRNHQSVFRKDSDGVYRIVGCNGVGVVKGTWLGHYMAEYMNGIASPDLDFIVANSRPSWMPPDPIRRIGAAMRLRREQGDAGGEV